MNLLAALLLVVALLTCWMLTLLSLPGNWLMVAVAAVYAYVVPPDSPTALGWPTVAVLACLAAVGELIEFLAGALGVAAAGGTRRGAVLALAGSFAGAILGIVLGLPIPLIGPLLAALLFAGLGALAGGLLGELSAGKNLDASWRIGKAAFWGRLVGTLGKATVGAVMAAVSAAALAF